MKLFLLFCAAVCIASSNAAYSPCVDVSEGAVAANDGVACKYKTHDGTKSGTPTTASPECADVLKGQTAPSSGIMCEFCALGKKGAIATFDGVFCDGSKTDGNCKPVAGAATAPSDGMYCPIPPVALANNCEVINKGAVANAAGAFFGLNSPGSNASSNAAKGATAPSFGVWCEGCVLVDATVIAPAAGTFWKYEDQTCSDAAKGAKAPGPGMFCKDKTCLNTPPAVKAAKKAVNDAPDVVGPNGEAEKTPAYNKRMGELRAAAVMEAFVKTADMAPKKSKPAAAVVPPKDSGKATSGVATLTVSAAAVLTSLAAMLQ